MLLCKAIEFVRGTVMLQLLYVETHEGNLENDLLLFTLLKSDRKHNKYRSSVYSTTERKVHAPWDVHSYFVSVIVFTFGRSCQTLNSIFVNCWVSFGTCSYRHKISKLRPYLQDCIPVEEPCDALTGDLMCKTTNLIREWCWCCICCYELEMKLVWSPGSWKCSCKWNTSGWFQSS